MCGINGLIGFDVRAANDIMKEMNNAIAHRGPDDEGIYLSDHLVLGHRRLSIIDLSKVGHQPMFSVNGRYVIVFNGEIYNFREIKKDILSIEPDCHFQSQTDTEVLLKAYELWGIDFLHRLNGMFAFALFDTFSKELVLVRDRLGIKPIYYSVSNGKISFSSEMRAILKSGLTKRKVSASSLGEYLKYQTVNAPNTILDDVHMLLPGHYMKFNLASDKFNPVVTEYWSLKNNINYTATTKSYDEIKSDVYRLLYNSVERRLIADVPFGAFLSGGIDSSAVVGLMSKISSVPVKTFSVTFDESEFSEAKYAELIAKKFGTDHSEIRLSPDAFRDQIPTALKAMDHPSGDGPNTYLVSKVTKEAGVSMALSGLGGDELFAGYEVFTRSLYLRKLKYLSIIPKSLRSMGTGLYKSISKHTRSEKIHELFSLSNFELRHTYPLSRKILSDSELQSLFSIPVENRTYITKELDNEHLLSSVSIAEMGTYMQNILLRDTDQMSMASSLEVRVPFMDYELVEYVLGVPDKFKIPHSPKKLLTDSLGDLLPDEVVNRPKMGFTFPWRDWMKNELRDFCESKLSSLAKRPYFNELAVKERWYRFLNDDQRISWSRIWYLVVLEDWLNENNIS